MTRANWQQIPSNPHFEGKSCQFALGECGLLGGYANPQEVRVNVAEPSSAGAAFETVRTPSRRHRNEPGRSTDSNEEPAGSDRPFLWMKAEGAPDVDPMTRDEPSILR